MKTFIKLLLLVAMVVPIGLNLAAQDANNTPSITPEKTSRIVSKTICEQNGGNNNLYAPFYCNRSNSSYPNTESQWIYPASELGLPIGTKIVGVSFYIYNNNTLSTNQTATWELKIKETDASDITSINVMKSNSETMTSVFTDQLTTGATTVPINFSSTFTYNGQNLMFDSHVVSSSRQNTQTYWAGKNSGSRNGMYTSNGTSGTGISFLPQMTIYYETEADAPVSGDTKYFSNEYFDYTWKEWKADGTGTEHPNTKLTDIATNPDHIIALLKKVYTDPAIPGNYKRGFDANGADEAGNDVSYAGVGTIDGNHSYADTYGWNIPANADNIKQYNNSGRYYMDPTQYKPNQNGLTILLVETNDSLLSDPTNFPPGFTPEDWMYTWRDVQGLADDSDYSYVNLRTYISKSIKSVRVLTEAKRTGEGFDAGTLFKIDCDKMNKFFLMAKGQLLLHRDSNCPYPYYYNGNWNDDGTYADYPFWHMFEQFSPVTSNATGGKEDIYQELVNMETFGVIHDCTRMFYRGHQFLMYGPDSKSSDCQDVRDMMFFVPDYRMIDWDGGTEPYPGEQRDPRNSSNWKYFNYNLDHQPKMGLFVIHQDEIPEGQEISRNTSDPDPQKWTGLYKHQLKWKSNLDDFLPGSEQYYELWEVVVDQFGVEKYVPVYYRDENGNYEFLLDEDGNKIPVLDEEGNEVEGEYQKKPIILDRNMLGAEFIYTDVYVDLTAGSQTKTYVIRGRDKGEFLSLQMSNQQEIFIPGLDPKEKAHMIGATYYSRFNPDNKKNCYSNKLELTNDGLTLTESDLAKGLQFYRSSRAAKVDANGNVVTDAQGNIQYADEANKELIASCTASNNKLYITISNPIDDSEFPKGKQDGKSAGYHANAETISFDYTVNSDNTINIVKYVNNRPVDTNLFFWDNFTVDVSKNAHPLQYLYRMEVGEQADAYSNNVRVPVYKTDSKINDAISLEDALGDTQMDDDYSPKDVEFQAKVQMSSKTEILRYDAYRWLESEKRYIVEEGGDTDEDEEDYDPTGIAGNQGGWYTVSMNEDTKPYYYVAPSDKQPRVDETNPTNWATFVDKYPTYVADSSAYIYAPVVELFTKGYYENPSNPNNKVKRKDYNTYGGPMKNVAIGKMTVIPASPENDPDPTLALMSDYKWFAKGKWYSYYNVYLNFSKLHLPKEYELYKVRAWRKVTGKIKNENNEYEELTGENVLGEEISTRQSRVVDGWYMYEDMNFGDDLGEYIYDENGEPVQHVEGYMSLDELAKDTYYLGHRSNTVGKPHNPDGSGGGPVFEPDSTANNNGNEDHEIVEENVKDEMRATFGALRLKTSENDPYGTLDSLNVEFKVRAYFVKTHDAAGLRNPLVTIPTRDEAANAADFDYYVTEATATFKQEAGPGVITGIGAVKMDVNREVVGVTYVNPVGQMSSTPWSGINIVVTRYSDGSTTTKKVLK